jgi:hypothetical protein
MPFIRAKFPEPMPLDQIVKSLFVAFPESSILDEDRFASRIAFAKGLVAKAERENRPTGGYEHVLASEEKAAAELGLTKVILLRVDGLSVRGTVCATSLLFATKEDEGIHAIRRIASYLRSSIPLAELEAD